MRIRLRSPRASLAALLLAPLLASCVAEDEGAVRGVTDDTIVLGTWAPLTGPAATWGSVARGAQAYFDLINEEGGIHGRRVELIVRDDAYQPSRTIAAVREMVERDDVFAMVGGVGTATGRAVMDYLVENDVVWVAPASGATHWAYPPKHNVFALATPYFDEAAVLVDHAVEELGLSRIAVIHQNDDFGRSGVVGAELALEKHGLELVAAVPVEVPDTDLSSHAVRIRAANADGVLMWLTPRHATIVVGAVERLGFRTQWLASSVLADTELMDELTQGAWEGVVYTAIGVLPASGHPLLERYRQAAARVAPGERVSEFFLGGFRYSEPLGEALRRAGRDLTTESLIAALESLDGWQGTGPPITYARDRRQGTRSMFLARALPGGASRELTDWMESDLDVEAAIRRLEGSE